jgi:hypothetical protein
MARELNAELDKVIGLRSTYDEASKLNHRLYNVCCKYQQEKFSKPDIWVKLNTWNPTELELRPGNPESYYLIAVMALLRYQEKQQNE